MLDTSEMDRLITLEYATVTRSRTGQEEKTWVSIGNIWAKYLPGYGKEYVAGGQVVGEADAIFRVHYRPNIGVGWRVHFQQQLYDVFAIKEIGRQDGLELATKILRIDGNGL